MYKADVVCLPRPSGTHFYGAQQMVVIYIIRNWTGGTILVKIRPSQWDGGTDSHLGFTSQISPYLSAQQMCIHLAYIPDFISGLLWFGHMCWGDMVLPVVVVEEVLALHLQCHCSAELAQ
jgi:hypothetical protein